LNDTETSINTLNKENIQLLTKLQKAESELAKARSEPKTQQVSQS
jgi:hypothetical protein